MAVDPLVALVVVEAAVERGVVADLLHHVRGVPALVVDADLASAHVAVEPLVQAPAARSALARVKVAVGPRTAVLVLPAARLTALRVAATVLTHGAVAVVVAVTGRLALPGRRTRRRHALRAEWAAASGPGPAHALRRAARDTLALLAHLPQGAAVARDAGLAAGGAQTDVLPPGLVAGLTRRTPRCLPAPGRAAGVQADLIPAAVGVHGAAVRALAAPPVADPPGAVGVAIAASDARPTTGPSLADFAEGAPARPRAVGPATHPALACLTDLSGGAAGIPTAADDASAPVAAQAGPAVDVPGAAGLAGRLVAHLAPRAAAVRSAPVRAGALCADPAEVAVPIDCAGRHDAPVDTARSCRGVERPVAALLAPGVAASLAQRAVPVDAAARGARAGQAHRPGGALPRGGAGRARGPGGA